MAQVKCGSFPERAELLLRLKRKGKKSWGKKSLGKEAKAPGNDWLVKWLAYVLKVLITFKVEKIRNKKHKIRNKKGRKGKGEG